MLKRSVVRTWWALAVVGLLGTGAAQAQDQPAPTTPTTTPSAPPNTDPAAAGGGQMAAQIGGMIGGAEYMLILDRPFEAEKLFGAVLSMDPNNAYAKQGLERVKFAKRPNWTFLYHAFKFSLDASMKAYGGGPSFYTRNLKSTFWVGDGWYKNNNDPNNPDNPLGFLGYQIGTADDEALRKQTYNATFEPYYKNFDGYVYLNRTIYQKAPDRTLWYAKGTWNRQRGRENYSLFAGSHDSYYQNDLAQYFAPESWTAVQTKLISREVGASAAIPLGPKVDFSPTFSRFDYTDGNTRRVGRFSAMYRLLPGSGKQMPILRVGLSGTYDDSDTTSLFYYSPLSHKALGLTVDYVYVTGKTRYILYGNYAFTGPSGEGFGRFPPPRVLYGAVNHKVTPGAELWAKFSGMNTEKSGPRFADVVVGITARF
ncbi:MAG TPA: hypothetical protein VM032_01230 [Vicinamibacterales bacterium]|nr:hypothetical protein [Vicinamibacterales bacterium]